MKSLRSFLRQPRSVIGAGMLLVLLLMGLLAPLLTPYDPTFERQMSVAEKLANRYRDALRELAK